MGRTGTLAVAAMPVVGIVAACGGDDGGSGGPQIVATTSILGDITSAVAGEDAEVETIMPAGSDPHEFEATARQAESMLDADLLVVNGAGFEEGLVDLIEQAEDAGVEVFTFTDHVEVLETGDHAEGEEAHAEESEEAEDEHADEGDEEGHEHGPVDPHFWTDPTRVAEGAAPLGEAIGQVEGFDAAAVADRTGAYVAELDDLDREIESTLATVPEERRVLVTNHEVFGYFADRYGFEVIGTVIPSLSTHAEPNQAQLEDLADLVEQYDLPAIFTETSQAGEEAEAVSREVGGVEVVPLYSESLGDEGSGADTYLGMMRTNADLVAEALR